MSKIEIEWIAVDWGTSQLRVWIFGKDNRVLDKMSSPKGMGALSPEEFEPALLELIKRHLPQDRVVPVVACGMVGAKQGWLDVPYLITPSAPHREVKFKKAKSHNPNIEVFILPGMCQTKPSDVMRGEETQIAGFLAGQPDFSGVLCMPGTHSKWVKITENIVASFQTIMTGELFASISKQTILRFSVEEGWVQQAFEMGVDEVLNAPESLLGKLFSIRANDILKGAKKTENYSYLSGLLIGSEIAGTKDYWSGQDVHLIGGSCITEAYALALKIASVVSYRHSGDELVLKGLQSAYGYVRMD